MDEYRSAQSSSPHRSPSRGRWLRTSTGVLALVVLGGWLALATRSGPPAPPPSPPPPPVVPVATTAPPPAPPPVPALTTIAEVTGPVPYSAEPNGPAVGTLPMGKWWKATKSLPVIEQQAGWLHVRLPERPNGSTGWIAAADATLDTTTYGILVDLTNYRLQLYESGKLVEDLPAGVGTPDDPTPTGQYYVMDVDNDPPGARWGPFILDTNAHSEAITSWEGTGDAFTAIHGSLGADAAIGADGAAISHGCVRLHNDDLAKLWPVPAGAPVVVVA